MKLKVIGSICVLLLVLIVFSCQSDDSIEFKRYYSDGSIVYQNHCQNCHGEKGEGLSSLIPPFTDTAYLKTNLASLSCKINYGFTGKLVVSGKDFDGNMPASGLTPIEIAQALTYVTNSFGNKLGVITVDEVNNDLNKCEN